MGLENSKLTTWFILRAKLETRLACWWEEVRVWEVYVRGELGSVYVVPLKVKVRGLQIQKLTLATERPPDRIKLFIFLFFFTALLSVVKYNKFVWRQ